MPVLNTLLQRVMWSTVHPSKRQEYRTTPTQLPGNSGSLNSAHHPSAKIRQPLQSCTKVPNEL